MKENRNIIKIVISNIHQLKTLTEFSESVIKSAPLTYFLKKDSVGNHHSDL